MLWFLFAGNFGLIIMLYLYLAEKSLRHSPSFIILNIAGTPPIFFALCSGFLLTSMYPGFLLETSMAAGVLGMGAGLLFGSLFHFHAAMAGAAYGLIAGMLSPVLGELAGRSPMFLVFCQLLFFIVLFFLRFHPRLY
ncbi:hypothetical protein [Alteribacillus iranensis]|uniref:Uncharacterized protein n=1 Tax=Alteribacillus iranensis TaxID=930128 RepID=A0A1I2D1V1_9BACI|nr:hypothetical protein [Alteribacillus iranensis]SFE74479.1 hypothetical protein SAMN05192532_103346 [Alteribacillus iranensis]